MNPYTESLVRKIRFHHYRLFHGRKEQVLTYRKCIKSLILYRGIGFARAKVNLGSLDILELRGRLRGQEEEINKRIIDRNISTINRRNEFRSFFYFLQMEFPMDYQKLPFIKRERPDFIVKVKKHIIGIEITEAIDADDAQQRTKVYKSRLRGRKSREIERYVDQADEDLRKKSTIALDKLISDRVKDKKEKFKDFYRADLEILIIIANHHEFQTGKDYERVRRQLEIDGLFQVAPFSSVVVMNLINDSFVHYQRKGKRVVIHKRNPTIQGLLNK